MVSIPKVVGLMSCGFLLCLGLSSTAQAGNAASAAADIQPGPSDNKKCTQANPKSYRYELPGENKECTQADPKSYQNELTANDKKCTQANPKSYRDELPGENKECTQADPKSYQK